MSCKDCNSSTLLPIDNQKQTKIDISDKECAYSKDVLSYLNRILYGYIDSTSKIEALKNKRRVAKILTSYDLRDVTNNTTIYNSLTYSQIKKLLCS